VRPLANYPREGSYDVLEGIIETDWWIGPLFTPIRLLKSDIEIEFRMGRPFAQLQLVNKEYYSGKTLAGARMSTGASSMEPALWDSLAKTLLQTSQPDRRPGSYKRNARIQRDSSP
jgi:hypothetical protein